MRLYITTWRDAENDDDVAPPRYEFTGTQADQKALERRLKDEGVRVENSKTVEVPVDKAGLMNFLNTYSARKP